MRLREMRRGQRARSGNWRADYLETRTVGSPGGRREKGRESGTSPAAYPTSDIRSKMRAVDASTRSLLLSSPYQAGGKKVSHALFLSSFENGYPQVASTVMTPLILPFELFLSARLL
jgi:hypothetical protein